MTRLTTSTAKACRTRGAVAAFACAVLALPVVAFAQGAPAEAVSDTSVSTEKAGPEKAAAEKAAPEKAALEGAATGNATPEGAATGNATPEKKTSPEKAAAPASDATPRDKTVAMLKRIAPDDVLGLEAWLQGVAGDEVHVGDEVSFRFRAAQDVYLTTVYLDAAGTLTLLHTGNASDRVAKGQIASFPPEGSNQRLVAQPPLGSELVFAIATLEPLPQDMFTDEAGQQRVQRYERPEDARHIAQRLADYVSILPEGSVDVAWFSQTIVPEDAPRHYTSSNIVEHFTVRTRGLTRPKLDLDIQFQFGSDALTDEARHDLDELGKALEHPAMKNRHFELAGHTDDVGPADYNMNLSKKRAESARTYLIQHYHIAPDALRPAGYGEEKPMMEGTSDEARRRNRRVVIEQLP